MEVRLAGRVTWARAVQPSKALASMEVRLAGRSAVACADGDEAAREGDRDERGGALPKRPVWEMRHAFGQHRVPIGDDDLPAAHVQSLGAVRRNRSAAATKKASRRASS